MPGRAGASRPLAYVGVLVAAVAAVGTAVFGWRFGDPGGAPLAIGVACAGLAVGVALYRRL